VRYPAGNDGSYDMDVLLLQGHAPALNADRDGMRCFHLLFLLLSLL